MPIFSIGLRVFGAFALLILIAWLIGCMLPRGYTTSAELTIAASPEQIFPYINRLDQWPKWSQWKQDKGSILQIQYGTTIEGEGAVQTWTEPRGTGKLWITRSTPNQEIAYVVDFANFPRMSSSFTLKPVPEGTQIEWKSEGRLPGGAFYGYLRVPFVNGLQEQYETALSQLSQTVTGKSPETAK